MSNTKTVVVNITEALLPALNQACRDLGLIFLANQTKYQTHEGRRDCVWAIKMDGQRHEIGVVAKHGVAGVYDLSADFYRCERLRQTVGDKFERLTARMKVNESKARLYERGAREIVEEVFDDRIRLVATY